MSNCKSHSLRYRLRTRIGLNPSLSSSPGFNPGTSPSHGTGSNSTAAVKPDRARLRCDGFSSLRCLGYLTVTTIATAALLWTPAAQAQRAGAWLLRAGATQISPNVVSGNLSAPSLAGTTADIEPDSQISGGLTHMLTDHWALDLPFAVPFTHALVGTGAIAGVGKIGETKVLPATLLGQYRFGAAEAPVRPYLGAGLTYANFYKERSTAALSGVTGGSPDTPTTFKVKSKFALSVQVGVSIALKNQWFVDASLVRTFLKTRSTLSTGQTLDAALDPDVISVGVGYRF